MKSETFYFYEEYVGFWISCGHGYRWTLDQCREKAMERKIVSPRSVLRIVKQTREVYSWRERKSVR